MTTPQKYRAKEVCVLLEVSKKTLYNLESRGIIPAVPRDWRGWRTYDESHLEEIRKYKASRNTESSRNIGKVSHETDFDEPKRKNLRSS